MFQKGNRYLADWYDRKGRRRRKSFETPELAQAFEDAQKTAARPNVSREEKPKEGAPATEPAAARAGACNDAPLGYGADVVRHPPHGSATLRPCMVGSKQERSAAWMIGIFVLGLLALFTFAMRVGIDLVG